MMRAGDIGLSVLACDGSTACDGGGAAAATDAASTAATDATTTTTTTTTAAATTTTTTTAATTTTTTTTTTTAAAAATTTTAPTLATGARVARGQWIGALQMMQEYEDEARHLSKARSRRSQGSGSGGGRARGNPTSSNPEGYVDDELREACRMALMSASVRESRRRRRARV